MGGERNFFFGGLRWMCVRVSLTHVSSSPNSSLHHPLREKKKTQLHPSPLPLGHYVYFTSSRHTQTKTYPWNDRPAKPNSK